MIDLTRIPGDQPFRLVDVGARGGVHPRWLRMGSRLQAILFEPEPEENKHLREASPAHWLVLDKAVASEPGQREFHALKRGGGSSFLPIDETLLSRYAGLSEYCEKDKTVSIAVDTVDRLLSESGETPVAHFIKLDTQGSELDILKGASQTLQTVVGLEIEVEFIPAYVNQPLFSDMDQYLRPLGFELFDLGRHYWQRKGPDDCWPRLKGQLSYGDALYFLPPELICLRARSAEDIWTAFMAYAAYGYADVAFALAVQAREADLVREAEAERALSLLNQERRSNLPSFRGRGLVHRLFHRMSDYFRGDSPTHSDTKLGN